MRLPVGFRCVGWLKMRPARGRGQWHMDGAGRARRAVACRVRSAPALPVDQLAVLRASDVAHGATAARAGQRPQGHRSCRAGRPPQPRGAGAAAARGGRRRTAYPNRRSAPVHGLISGSATCKVVNATLDYGPRPASAAFTTSAVVNLTLADFGESSAGSRTTARGRTPLPHFPPSSPRTPAAPAAHSPPSSVQTPRARRAHRRHASSALQQYHATALRHGR
jgi:hypothetical protein